MSYNVEWTEGLEIIGDSDSEMYRCFHGNLGVLGSQLARLFYDDSSIFICQVFNVP